MIDENILQLTEEAHSKISSTSNIQELESLRVHYLGKKGQVTALLHGLKDLDPEKRRNVGAVINEAKSKLEAQFEKQKSYIQQSKLNDELASSHPIDVTLSGQYATQLGSLHPVTFVVQEMVSLLQRIGFSMAQGPEVETEYYNFEALNTPENHPARDLQDTFYIKRPVLLRSHTSPVQIRAMKNQKPPVQILSTGRVYRSDYDQTHTPMFHQMEGLMVDEKISLADLKGVLQYLVHGLFGQRKLRFRPSYFPFTEPSAEVDMEWNNGEWLEIGGCGMVHPKVFESVGYDVERYTGFAFGMGIERIAMLKYGITDLRSFFENDYRMLEQF